LIESPGWITVPVELVRNPPLPCSTDVVGWNTVRVAAALGAAAAAVETQKKAAPTMSKTTSRMMMRR
jgi:hypothetical protein